MSSSITDQTIFRVASVQKPFSMLGNEMLQDVRISIAARGLLGSILSRSPGWEFNFTWLRNAHGISRDKAYKFIAELEAAGYCIRWQKPLGGNRWGPISYQFTDSPALFAEQHPEIMKAARKWREGQDKRAGIIPAKNEAKQRGRPKKTPLPGKPYPETPHPENTEAIERNKDSEINKDSERLEESSIGFQPEGGREEVLQPAGELAPKPAGRGRRAPELGLGDRETADEKAAAIAAGRSEEETAYRAYCDLADEIGMERPAAFTPRRREQVRELFRTFGADSWARGLDRIRQSADFFKGQNGLGWRMTFDKLVTVDFFAGLLEGKYAPRQAGGGSGGNVTAIADLTNITAKKWAQRCRIWQEAGRRHWPADWGPEPGKPGCAVPADILAQCATDAAAE